MLLMVYEIIFNTRVAIFVNAKFSAAKLKAHVSVDVTDKETTGCKK